MEPWSFNSQNTTRLQGELLLWMFLISFSPQGHITLKWVCLSWNQFNIVYQWIRRLHYYPAHPGHNIPATVMTNESKKREALTDVQIQTLSLSFFLSLVLSLPSTHPIIIILLVFFLLTIYILSPLNSTFFLCELPFSLPLPVPSCFILSMQDVVIILIAF